MKKQVLLWTVMLASLLALLFSRSGVQGKTLTTHTDILRWLQEEMDAPPLFRDGDILTQKDLDKIRPFLPPGYFDEFHFAGVEFPVSPSGNYIPHQDYLAATEQYLNQARIAADGALENYIAGRPFAQTQITPDDPKSGLKAAWNFNHRWKFYGMHVQRYLGALLAKGGTASPLPGFPADLVQGGGAAERYLVALYRQAYHSHLAQLAKSNYLLPTPGAGEFEYKHYLEFLEPYDVRGSRFLIYRYDDPRRQDDAWSFLPQLRKVRRLSLNERDDPIAGTEMTLDDFMGFSGRVLDHQWKFLGQKTILHVMNSRHPYARFYGPNGWLPNDRWELRPCVVVEQTPLVARTYGSKIFFWDAQTYETVLVLIFDRQGNLWKVNHLLHGWSEDPTQPAVDRGKRLPRNIGSTIIDLQKQQATIFSAYEIIYPEIDAKTVADEYDVNRLSEGKR
jgi:hypothetical protein